MTARSLRFPAARRLKLAREFARVRRQGQTARGKFLLLGALATGEAEAMRSGFVTSRKVGGAVVRNRVRRRLREIVRRHQHEITAGVWLVVVARPAAADASAAELEREWLQLAERSGILRMI